MLCRQFCIDGSWRLLDHLGKVANLSTRRLYDFWRQVGASKKAQVLWMGMVFVSPWCRVCVVLVFFYLKNKAARFLWKARQQLLKLEFR